MSDQYPWNRGRTTSDEIADEDDPRYETPIGSQQKADMALADAKEYTDTEIEALPDIVGGIGIAVTEENNEIVITSVGVSIPIAHASTHVTGGTDIIPDAAASGNSGLMTGPDKAKLDGVANNANNYTHPNHSGDVTSIGDGVTAIAAGVIVNADVNASAAIDASKIGTGVVSNTEFGYLDGVTSAIQTQLNTKWGTGTLGSRAFVEAFKNSSQSITANTMTKVLFDIEGTDQLNEFASSRYTASQNCIILVVSRIAISNPADQQTLEVNIIRNGEFTLRAGLMRQETSGTRAYQMVELTNVVILSSGDYIEIYVNSTADATIPADLNLNQLKIISLAN
jgi:hypothetical protein